MLPWSYAIPHLLCFVILMGLSGALALSTARRAPREGAPRAACRWLALTLAGQGAWVLGATVELMSPSLTGKLLWDHVQWLPFPLIGAGATGLAVRYAGMSPRRGRVCTIGAACLCALAVAAVLLSVALCNTRAGAAISYADGVPSLHYDFTAFDYAACGVLIGIVAASSLILLLSLRGQALGHRWRTGLLVIGLIVPWILQTVGFQQISILGQRDLSPFAFAIGALVLTWGVVEDKLLDVLPIAHRTVLRDIPDAVIVIDQQRRLIDLNRAGRALQPNKPHIGAPVSAWYPELHAALSDAPAGTSRYVALGAQWLSAQVVALGDPGGNAQGFAWVLRDLTGSERVRLELEQRVSAQSQQTAKLVERLQQSERLDALGRLVASVAHDFNNLLTVIVGNATLLREELREDSSLGSDLLTDLEQAGAQAALLTRQLLQLGRHSPPSESVLVPDEELERHAKLLTRLVAPVPLRFDLRAPTASVRLSNEHFVQSVANLLINARQALGHSGKVIVKTERLLCAAPPPAAIGPLFCPGAHVLVRVVDSGPGMPPEVQRRALEPFFTTKASGTGLGLSTVHSIVVRAGGLMSIRSAPGKGTSIELYFPEAPGDLRSSAITISCRGRRVLVVSEREDTRMAIAPFLTQLGATVVEARGVASALQLLVDSERLDCLIADAADVPLTELGDRVRNVTHLLPLIVLHQGPLDRSISAWARRNKVLMLAKPVDVHTLAERVARGDLGLQLSAGNQGTIVRAQRNPARSVGSAAARR